MSDFLGAAKRMAGLVVLTTVFAIEIVVAHKILFVFIDWINSL